jgi:2-iminobutanoate/2-iminopropanoate deaminase
VTGQTIQIFENLKNILEFTSSSLSKVLKVTVMLQNVSDFSEMNDVYAQYFSSNYPARSTLQATIPRNALVELDVIAYKD